MNLMKDWPIKAKLGLVGAIVFGLIIYLASQSVHKFYGDYQFAEQEKAGAKYLKNYFNGDAWFAVMARRGAVVRYLAGDKAAEGGISEATSKVDAAISALHENDKQYAGTHDHSARLQKIDSLWADIKSKGLSMSPDQAFALHTELVDEMDFLYMDEADAASLSLDPEKGSYYLVDMVVNRLPEMMQAMGQVRGKAVLMMMRNGGTDVEKADLHSLVDSIRTEDYNRNIKIAVDGNPDIKDLAQRFESTNARIDELSQLGRRVADGQVEGLSPARIQSQGDSSIGASKELLLSLISDLDVMLTERASSAKTSFLVVSVLSVLGLMLSAFIGYVVVRGFNRDISHANAVLKSMADGNLDNQVMVLGHDELGTMLEMLGGMQDTLRNNINREREEAVKAARVKQALDAVSTNAMIADIDGNIVYLNRSVNAMLKVAESDIRKELPKFDAEHLLGVNFDVFHKNPAHQRNLLGKLKETYQTEIKVGGRTFRLIANPVFNDQGERIGSVVEWLDRTEELVRIEQETRLARDNARVKQALDAVNTNAMIADADGNIIYTNAAVGRMLKHAESDLRKVLPQFSADKVLGSNFDIFHKNPAHQRNLLGQLKSTYQTQIVVGGRTFALTANPVSTESGERIGSVVEWVDRTDEVAMEKQVDEVITAAASGDLTGRIPVEGKSGFFRKISEGLNQLITVTEEAVGETATVLDAMAHGDLTKTMNSNYEGVFGKLKTDANATVEKLTEIINSIREAAHQVSNGANEIAQGNADLSQRTEEQASSLEETASSMEEMTSVVRQTADNAKQANVLAIDTREKAKVGGEVVNRAVHAMQEINASSKKIADIIGVIDEIAFQTNLLALNAAVEAARAGEQGRGFAVVAGEVRNLAQRSAAAAKEIKELIRDSVTKVEDGTQLVNDSGTTLDGIVKAVERVTSMIEDIATAAAEQTSGIEQVNTAVSQMDEMTQQNAALVEEASAAGEAMNDQARQLMRMMDFFNTGDITSSSAVTASVRTPKASPGKASGRAAPASDEWEEF